MQGRGRSAAPGETRDEFTGPGPAARLEASPGLPPLFFWAAALLAIVASAAVSTPDGQAGAGAGRPGKLSLHASRIDGLAFSPDGRLVASASSDGTTKICDLATHRQRQVSGLGPSGFTWVAFSPDGRTIAAGNFDGRVALSNLGDGRPLGSFRAIPTPGSVRSGAFSPDGDRLATGGDDRAVRVWDARSRVELLAAPGHAATVNGLAYTPDGRAILSVAADGRAILRDARTGEIRDHFDAGSGPLRSVAISRDGRWAALGGRDGITLRDLAGGRSRARGCPGGPITSLGFLPCSSMLASAGLEGTVTLWKLEGDELRRWRVLDGQECRVKSLAVSPAGKRLITGGDDGVLRFWAL